MARKSSYFFVALYGMGVLMLWVLSTHTVREYLFKRSRSNNPRHALRHLEKMIRKAEVSRGFSREELAPLYYQRGRLFATLKLKEKAFQHYRRALELDARLSFPAKEQGGFKEEMIVAQAVFEAQQWERAHKEFLMLQEKYPSRGEIALYIDITKQLETMGYERGKEACFAIGDAYVEAGMWTEARAYFTKRILTHCKPEEVLQYVQKKYGREHYRAIREKIWGKHFYVCLEDFESVTPRLYRWLSSTPPYKVTHRIVSSVAYEGNHSEYFCMAYTQRKGFDYYVKDTALPLDFERGFSFGIRAYVKSKSNLNPRLKVNIFYPEEGTNAIWQFDITGESKERGWVVREIDDVVTKAIHSARQRKWLFNGARIDKVIIDTQMVSGEFYIDSIELFVCHHPPSKVQG